MLMKISLSDHFILSDREGMKLLNLPHDIMREQLFKYIETRQSLPEKVVVQIFRQHQKIGDDLLRFCIEKLLMFPEAAQMEIFNLPMELRDELLLMYAKKSSKRFCDIALVNILDLPSDVMIEIITTYLGHGGFLPKEAELKIARFEQNVAEKIFSVYQYLPEADVFDVVFAKWDDATKREFFLDNIKDLGSFEFNNRYDTIKRIVDLILKFPVVYRDKLLSAFFDKGYFDDKIMKKICTIEEPSRKSLLMRQTYSLDGIDILLKLPEPTRSEVILHQIEENCFCDFVGSQVRKFFSFPEPYRSRVLRAYAERFVNLFEYASKEVLAMPEPLRTELVLSSLSPLVIKKLFKLPEPLRTKALCAYFSSDKPRIDDISGVYKLPDVSRKAILLAAIRAKKKRYLFDSVNCWGSPYKRQLFELPEPSRTEVITAYVENGWKLDEPWMLWLLPKEVSDPLIKEYAAKHKDFYPSQYEEKIKDILG